MGAIHAQALIQILCSNRGSDDRFLAVYPVDLIARLVGFLRVKFPVTGILQDRHCLFYTFSLGLSLI